MGQSFASARRENFMVVEDAFVATACGTRWDFTMKFSSLPVACGTINGIIMAVGFDLFFVVLFASSLGEWPLVRAE